MCAGDEAPFVGRHYHLERPLNRPLPLTRPHPPIMIGGGGEKKTLRLVAQYADACNLFNGPDLEHKLEVLRQHCDAVGRDYDEIHKTAYYRFDVGTQGEKTGSTVAELERLGKLGIDMAIGQVADAHTLTPLEVIGRDIIPAVADF
jgi:alkanesulfonate monooxygenase SsuD/methylene tetrahydromethanopterin reductase-like flavin-dependent oxidoreductase (luciferase family)